MCSAESQAERERERDRDDHELFMNASLEECGREERGGGETQEKIMASVTAYTSAGKSTAKIIHSCPSPALLASPVVCYWL